MGLFSIGVDFKKATLEVRAKAAHPSLLENPLLLGEKIEEIVFVATCNRVEAYISSQSSAPEELLESWSRICSFGDGEMKSFEVFEGVEMLTRLFRIASSMESMVVGETQITGQLKRAYDRSLERRTIGPTLNKVFQIAFRSAKRVRQQTEVGRLAVSIPSIGVKLSEKVVGDLGQKTVGILGLGEIGRLSAEHFASVQPRNLLLYNRTLETARRIASEFEAERVKAAVCENIREILEKADVIVSAVDGVILKSEDLKFLDGRGNPIFVLDLSVPRSVEVVNGLERTFTFALDDLKKIAEENTSLRKQELIRAERIIEDEVKACLAQLSPASVHEAFGLLSLKVDKMTKEELAALKSKLPLISSEDWAEIEKTAYRLTSKVLQDPMRELKTQIRQTGGSEDLVQFFRNLFKV